VEAESLLVLALVLKSLPVLGQLLLQLRGLALEKVFDLHHLKLRRCYPQGFVLGLKFHPVRSRPKGLWFGFVMLLVRQLGL